MRKFKKLLKKVSIYRPMDFNQNSAVTLKNTNL